METDLIDCIAAASSNLIEEYSSQKSNDQLIDKILLKHLKSFDQQQLKIQDFRNGLEWFNVSKQLSLNVELRGKIVVLDFFTYCCINCMHILPDLKALENEFSIEDGLVVVGVHSAKFDNEKDSANILAALQRYEISHPVVNDSEGTMWNELGIPCWPTLLILGPSGEALFIIIGEGQKEDLFLFVQSALKYYKEEGRLLTHSLPLSPASHLTAKNKDVLRFPGKVASCLLLPTGSEERLALSDTGHHRILILTPDGKIEFEIGGYTPGFLDGNLSEARFHSPQGLVFSTPFLLYVADTENHAIREINLKTCRVSTIAGTGSQGTDKSGGGKGAQQALSSPWDLCLFRSVPPLDNKPQDEEFNVLLIAIAGTHQIWGHFLNTTTWWKGKVYEAGTTVALVGTGKEENRNNSYPHMAAFAQPSGLSVAPSLRYLFVADSESSSVRKVSLADGKVTAVVGGDRSPTNLFGFGDVDGKQYDAKLQHPLGVAWCPRDEKLYVADSYNHKIKVVDVGNNFCTTLFGCGKPGRGIGDISVPYNVELNEPGGLCSSPDGERLYVADTNNHCIKVVHLADKSVSEIPIFVASKFDQSQDVSKPTEVSINTAGGDISIVLAVSLADDLHLTPEAPQKWSMKLPDCSWSASSCSGEYQPEVSVKVFVPSAATTSSSDVSIDYKLYLCSKQSECFVRNLKSRITVVYANDAPTSISHYFSHVIGSNGIRSTSYNVLPSFFDKVLTL